jgi:N-acetylmuramoyl-L-alanine amidase
MPDGPHRDPWDLRRLGDEDFISEPLHPARPRPDDDDDDLLDTAVTVLPPARGRRLRRDERDELRRQARERRKLPPEYFGQAPKKKRWPRWGGVALLLAIIIIAGNIRLFSGGGDGDDPPPTVTVAPTATVPAVAAVVSPTVTETPTQEPTPSPEPTFTPTPEPTADPRFRGEVICLDPGHGGSDRGYTRENAGGAPAMEEAPINLDIALQVKDRLEQLGFTVVMTRTRDADVNASGSDVNGDGQTGANQSELAAAERAKAIDELQARINVCNEANAELLLSIHINGYPDSTVSGYETWYSSSRPFEGQNKLIATLIFDEMGKAFAAGGYNVEERQVRDDATADIGGSRDVFDQYVITGPAQPGSVVASEMPGAIIESLFISSHSDAAILATEDGITAIVDAYVNGIVAYFDIILGPAPESDRESTND